MTAKEFLEKMANGSYDEAPKLCGCGCGKPLGPRVDGSRQMLGGVEVNADCYFEKLGELVESSPIRTPRRIGPGVCLDVIEAKDLENSMNRIDPNDDFCST